MEPNPGARIRGSALPAPSRWRVIGDTGEPNFAHSWANYGTTYADTSYYKEGLGRVHLRGAIKSGTVGQSAFTLPDGYAPADDLVFPVASYNGAAWVVAAVQVLSSGAVTPVAGSNTLLSLNGVSFRAQ